MFLGSLKFFLGSKTKMSSNNGTRVFIGGLSPRAKEFDVERFFKGFGKIRDINLKQGYGFVEFDDARDADDAVYEMNNQSLCGGRITVEHAKGTPRSRDSYNDRGGDRNGGRGGGFGGGRGGYGRDDRGSFNDRSRSRYGPASRTKYRLIVENVSSRTGWQDLKDLFRPVVEVAYAEAHQGVRGEGILEFHSQQDLNKAIDELDGTELNGRKLKLVEEGGFKSRSRSRSPVSRGSPRRRSYSRSPAPRDGSRSPY